MTFTTNSFQRRQADAGGRSSLQIVRAALQNEGFVAGLYRGFGTTVLREIPFSLIQFPLWEYFKTFETEGVPPATKSAVCGSLAGGQFNRHFLRPKICPKACSKSHFWNFGIV